MRRTSSTAPAASRLRSCDEALGLVRVALDQARGDVEPEGDTGEGGAEAVMQVTADPTPFLLTGLDQLTSRGAECIGEPDGVDRGTGRAGQVGQQRRIAGREGPVVAAGDQQPPDPLPLVLQRKFDRCDAVELAGAGLRAAGGLDGHVGQPQRGRDGLRNCAQ